MSQPTTQATPLILDDARWDRLLDLTGGAAAPCFQCGVCTASCPWGLVRQETVSVRSLMRLAQLGIQVENESLWLCTTCAQCEATCPRGVPIARVVRGLRQLAWEERHEPPGLPTLLWSLYWNENPWSQPPSQRFQWARDLDLAPFDPAQHEILLYVGCTACYDRRAQKVARSLVQVLEAAGVAFGVLGDAEPCCGEAALSVGHEPYLAEIARQTADLFIEHGVTRLVTISPHCYDVFRNHYPRVVPDLPPAFAPLHYTQYLAELLTSGRLQLKTPIGRPVTFHDPCYLARHNDEQDAPRQVLAALPEIEIREMPHAGVTTLCCGGGGGRMWLETASGERFSDVRVREAQGTGASLLITACPFCITCLEDSLKSQRTADLAVLDVAELAALALGE